MHPTTASPHQRIALAHTMATLPHCITTIRTAHCAPRTAYHRREFTHVPTHHTQWAPRPGRALNFRSHKLARHTTPPDTREHNHTHRSIVDASDIAGPFRSETRARINALFNFGAKIRTENSEIFPSTSTCSPKLVGILANDDDAARKYAQWTMKACTADNIQYELREVDKMDVERALAEANSDASVHGIIIYYPIFGEDNRFVHVHTCL